MACSSDLWTFHSAAVRQQQDSNLLINLVLQEQSRLNYLLQTSQAYIHGQNSFSQLTLPLVVSKLILWTCMTGSQKTISNALLFFSNHQSAALGLTSLTIYMFINYTYLRYPGQIMPTQLEIHLFLRFTVWSDCSYILFVLRSIQHFVYF